MWGVVTFVVTRDYTSAKPSCVKTNVYQLKRNLKNNELVSVTHNDYELNILSTVVCAL